MPELAGELQAVNKRTGQKELEVLQDGVEQLALQDGVEQVALQDGAEQLALQDGVEQLALQDGVEQLALLDEVEDDASSAGVDSAVRMSNLELQASGAFKRFGELGKASGVLGAEFGRLGGRPRKSQVEGQLVQVQKVLLSNYNRKELSIKSKRDDSFGIIARLEICKLVRKLLPLVERPHGPTEGQG